jgi:hypothetical protein
LTIPSNMRCTAYSRICGVGFPAVMGKYLALRHYVLLYNDLPGVRENDPILLPNLLQSSRSTFSWGSFPSFFAFKAGRWDTRISALWGWPTVIHEPGLSTAYGNREAIFRRVSGGVVRYLSARLCHYFVPKKVVHTFSGFMLYQFEHHMEVANCLLTRGDIKIKCSLLTRELHKPPAHTEPILT